LWRIFCAALRGTGRSCGRGGAEEGENRTAEGPLPAACHRYRYRSSAVSSVYLLAFHFPFSGSYMFPSDSGAQRSSVTG
jgi:hypothetical protein